MRFINTNVSIVDLMLPRLPMVRGHLGTGDLELFQGGKRIRNKLRDTKNAYTLAILHMPSERCPVLIFRKPQLSQHSFSKPPVIARSTDAWFIHVQTYLRVGRSGPSV